MIDYEMFEKEISKGNVHESIVKIYNKIKSNEFYSHIEDEDKIHCEKCGVVSEELNENDLCNNCN